MTYRSQSAWMPLMQTLLISVGGFLVVKLLASSSLLSDAELLVGPVAVALMWFGLHRAEKVIHTSGRRIR
jgi:hypothetical protein